MLKSAQKNQNRTRDLVLIAIFVALITLGSFLRFPLGSVPISMQFAFCLLAVLTLGASRACVCVLIYIAMGLIGLPIFAGGGGFQYVLQPSFGYLIGFLLGAFVAGTLVQGGKLTHLRLMGASLLYLLVVYLIGCGYMYAILNLYLGDSVSVGRVLVGGCAIFLPFDLTWCVVMSYLAKKLRTSTKLGAYRACRA